MNLTIKTLAIASALILCLGAKAQKYNSPVYNAGGMVMKQETVIDISDSLASFTDSKSGKTKKYKVVSKGMNNNFKISDGVNEIALSLVDGPQKVKGTEYKKHLLFQQGQSVILYYIKD